MGNYKLFEDMYIIKDYDEMPTFTSFLPGLSGVRGVPLWLFYVNRGQGIASFGIHNKSNAIMEFNPANTGYENTSLKGFRTFLRIDGHFYEPFVTLSDTAKRTMSIRKNSLEILEVNDSLRVSVKVVYYILPNESIGALVRDVTITNLMDFDRKFEVLDGMPKIIPYGISNGSYKEMSNLLKSWTDIKNLEHKIPFIAMRASSDDSAEVSEVEGGYFYLSVYNGEVMEPVYDADIIFDYDTSLIHPVVFEKNSLDYIKESEQCFANKVPCAFTPVSETVPGKKCINFTSYIGFTKTPDQINEKAECMCSVGYVNMKHVEADELADEFTGDIKTKTALPVFDEYLKQCYLDNFLRGGYPFVFSDKENPPVVHLFSRKHGDPERDYNFFSIAGEYYSQGNGNFRDVCQNRRNDVFFKKEIGNYNVKVFCQLIQADGYNPLEVRPATFQVKEEKQKSLLFEVANKIKGENERLVSLLKGSFTPGKISNCISRNHIELSVNEEEFIRMILADSDQQIEAGFGEGYWSDHWDYILDLIRNYEQIYPDKMKELLFLDPTYRFYDSPYYVLPRSEKYVVAKNGVRQYGAGIFDEEKCVREGFVKDGSNWLKDEAGNLVHTTLIVKLLSLALNKFATLDPYGMGIEMEGGKPGWNDAMNGLPGLFGSGMAETFELKRLLLFLKDNIGRAESVLVPKQIWEYFCAVNQWLELNLTGELNEFSYWDNASTVREKYREQVRYMMSSEVCEVSTKQINAVIERFLLKLETGILKAMDTQKGIIPTYFTYQVTSYDTVTDESGELIKTHYGLPRAVVHGFDLVPVPLFLEGPARMIGTMKESSAARDMYSAIRISGIYDSNLGMYKTSEPIEHISMENGRIRAFTPGWLERESVFLHMEYKYLYALLKAGLYDEFYSDIKTALIPFLSPDVYGRSILENSSFLASSANPDKKIHGRGFVSRLSGSTTEMLSMWITMFAGDKLFDYEDGELTLTLEPKLADYFFGDLGEVSFLFLSNCLITYKNPSGRSTYGETGVRIQSIRAVDGSFLTEGNVIYGDFARAVRDGRINELIVSLGV